MAPPQSHARVKNDSLAGRFLLHPGVTAGKNNCFIHVQVSKLSEMKIPRVRECLSYYTLAIHGTYIETFNS